MQCETILSRYDNYNVLSLYTFLNLCPVINTYAHICFSSCFQATLALDHSFSLLYKERMKFSKNLEFIGCAEHTARAEKEETLPLYLSAVEAGFPSPADDYIDNEINLHDFLVRNKNATFFLKAHGESMHGAGIHDGDLLIVDRSVEASHNKIVIAAIDGELTVKRLLRRPRGAVLAPENPLYPEIDITDKEYVYIWGVVTFSIHSTQ